MTRKKIKRKKREKEERKRERIVVNEAKAGGRWERTGKLDR